MPADPASDLRRSAYLLLTAVAVAIAVAKVVGAENVVEPSRYKAPAAGGYGLEPKREWPTVRPEPSPTFSSNDRSRWATVRALVENGTYVVGRRDKFREKTGYTDAGIVFENDYQTLDRVMNPETGEFYSSKPPLFSTLIAGEYWVLKTVFGWSITANRWLVVCTILVTVNVIPFAVYLVLLSRLIDVAGRTDFGRLFAFAAACCGTFLLTFSGTLNNHTPAAFAVLFAVYPVLTAAVQGRDMTPLGYAACGFFAGFATTCELPAAAFLAGVGVPFLIARTRETVLFFLPAALVPVIALFACNYAAMGTLLPAYSEFGGPWYNYPGSHWAKRGTPAAVGIDFNQEPTHVYAFHLLLGHHGWFGLTPVWLVSLVGLGFAAKRTIPDALRLVRSRGRGLVWTPGLFAGMTLTISLVVFCFYLTRTASYNYGGNTSGPRWLFWLTPLWLIALPGGADRLAGSRWLRVLAAGLLGWSVMSAFYPAWNPWRPPWMQQLLEYGGWLRY